MITVNIRKQGGAAVMTIPSNILHMLDIEVGERLALKVEDGLLVVKPLSHETAHKRYSLKELLKGITPKIIAQMKKETKFAREGEPVGRELL